MAKKNRRSNLLPIVACLIVMFSIGIVYLWSVFQQPVMDYYGWSQDSVRMIPSLMIFMFIFGSMIGGFIQDKKSPRFVILAGGVLLFAGLFTTSFLSPKAPVWMMYITYGMIAGCGVGFVYTGGVNCIQKWFPHRLGFASGLAVCAFGLSALVFTPLIEWLLKLPAFGDSTLTPTFRTLAVIFSVLIIGAGFFVKNPGEEYIRSLNLPAKQTNKKQYKLSEAVRTFPFWCLALTIFFLPAAFFILNPLVKTLAAARGIPETQATLTLSLTGIVQAVSRLLSGIVSDKIGRARTVFILAVIMLVSALLMTFAGGWFYTVVVWLIFFAYGGPSSIYPAMTTDAYGTKHGGGNYGVALMFMGISSPVFTMVSNLINADGFETGNYTLSFIFAACCCVIPLIAMPLFDVFKKRLENKQDESFPTS